MNPFLGVHIDRKSPTPLYHQLEQGIVRLVEGGDLQVGTKLPAEEELVELTGLSRFTVRQALHTLEKEGRVRRVHGKGTFVSEPRVPLAAVWQLVGFSEDMARKGHVVRSRIIEKSMVPATEQVASELGLGTDTPVFRLIRLRILDGHEFSVDTICLRTDICPAIENTDLTDASLFKTLRSAYGIRIARAKRTLTIALAEPWAAGLLKVAPGTPLFHLRDLTFTDSDEPVWLADTLMNERKAEFVFDLVSPEGLETASMVAIDRSSNPDLRR